MNNKQTSKAVTYDFAIIGGGIGGLIFAQILSKAGKKVIVLEKNNRVGGAIQGFSRQGVTFDTGAHYIGGIDKGQNLYQYFNYLEIYNKLNLEKLDEDCFDKIIFESDGKSFNYAQGYDNFVEVMSRDFPDNRSEIQKYVDEIRKVGQEYPMYSLDVSNGVEVKLNETHLTKSVGEFLDEITDNEDLKKVLAASNLVYAGDSETTPYYIHALILNSYLESSYRLVGGASQIAIELKARIEARGNIVQTKAQVVDFTFGEGKEIQSVKLSNGEEVVAANYISNIHPSITLDMVPTGKIRKSYRHRIESIENTYSIFSIYIILKPNTFKSLNFNTYYFGDDDIWNKDNDKGKWPKAFMMITQAETKGQEYADGITAISPMDFDMVEQWKETKFKDRPQAYKDFKLKMQEKFLDLLEVKYPGLRSKIKYVEVNTPLTYEHYTHSPKGSLYGIIRNSKDPLRTHIAPYTKIPNLFFVGQNIDIHGVLGVTVGAFMAAGLFLDLEKLLENVNNCSSSAELNN